MNKTDIQIRFADIDGFNHVNNIAIMHYYDLGITNYFKEIGVKDLFVGVVKVNTQVNFMDSILHDDEIEVQTNVVNIGNKSITFNQQIVDKQSGIVKSNCLTVLAGYDSNTRKGAEIDDELKNKIKKMESINGVNS